MFLIQDEKSSTAYKAGYEIGQWIAHNSFLAVLLGVVVSVGFVWILTKVVKQIRNFGE
ncbi:hypothetical protein MK851_01880 [Tenacibaculum sp. 1B UA]|uniref:hypothetical protein n=1 Tax=unclassified Tenacibaculum TaxID=2635139 RepID=UPI0026E31839|nr:MULTISPECIES: hypothetical protein [unclassified Tenacibaculum]MDO6674044.1 hypothetical protein [Tenacibaculum sp. 1_MG-2023]MDX8552373.1 hypothetical protein [Tenacibaculum sp. 1B UA]